jgi:ABC-2 type transport system ATP-binding protein
VAETLISHLSKGYRQRVGLADALVASPPLLILDEPTAGLDPNQIREVRELLRELGRDHTILLSTHILSEVEAVCSRALVIHRGKLVAEGTIDALRARGRGRSLVASVRDPDARAESVARAVSGVAAVTTSRGREPALAKLEIELTDGADAGRVTEALSQALVSAGIGVRAVGAGTASLEQVFAALTERAAGNDGAGGAP